MTVTCGPMGGSVVRDWDVTEEYYYCDLLNYSSMKEPNTQSDRERGRECPLGGHEALLSCAQAHIKCLSIF